MQIFSSRLLQVLRSEVIHQTELDKKKKKKKKLGEEAFVWSLQSKTSLVQIHQKRHVKFDCPVSAGWDSNVFKHLIILLCV